MMGYQQWLELQKYSRNTVKIYTYFYKLLDEFLGGEDLDQDQLNLFIAQHNHKVCRAFVRTLIRYSKSQGSEMFDKLIIERLRGARVKKEPHYLNKEEIIRLAESFSRPDLKTLVYVLFETGLRISEAVTLRKKHINFKERMIVGTYGTMTIKRNKDFKVRISTATARRLFELLKGKPMDSRPFNFARETAFRKIRKQGYLVLNKYVHPHAFRHSTATYFLGRGFNLKEVKEIMRHDSISSTEIYAHIDRRELERKINKVLED